MSTDERKTRRELGKLKFDKPEKREETPKAERTPIINIDDEENADWLHEMTARREDTSEEETDK
jgi:hypothetical protein